ncbi:hypothetical protein MFIFM68171_02483 [Madurella fahalii]|uniref:NACHT domain-containing protein n=1 Tax=Madurella fahalii TaxID=1157608 RepID=A0ABQ0G3C8_9PEZI
MDPVSLALGIAGLLPLIAKAISSAKAYTDKVITAKDSIAALTNELEALQLNVNNLQQFLKHDAIAGSSLRFRQTSALLVCHGACEAKLRSLCKKLGQEDGKMRSRFLWPLSQEEHQKTLEELRRFTTWMHFALSVDGCRLLSQTADDVLKLLGQQLAQFKAIRSLEEATATIHDTVKGQTVMLENSLARNQRENILDWISTTNYFQKHQALQASRARDTGNWILHCPEYTRWRDGSDETGVLWCRGIQGSGKTNLVSILIDSLSSLEADTRRPVAYYYFDHQDQSSHSPSTVLACVLRQLLERLPTIPKAVLSAYESARPQGGLPRFECERLIAELIKELGRVYLVVDALDECDAEHRATFLQALRELSRIRGFRLLITSRPHTREISAALTNCLRLNIAARDEDIRLYLHQELVRKGIYEMADEAFAKRLIEKLVQGANGMFLLPVLQLRTISKEPTLGEMEDSLNNLSHNLTDAFEQTIRRIQGLPASRSRIGIATLMYIVHAARPITVQELSDLLAMHPDRTRVHAKYRPTEKMLLECCQGLITIDARTGDVRTSHYSVNEYLLQNDHHLFPRAKAVFAVKCLRYIMLEDFSAGPWETEDEIISHINRYPFLSYAVQCWGKHVKPSEDDKEVQATLADFFASTSAMAMANQVRQYLMGYRDDYWNAEECLSFTPLHHACRHGLLQTAKRLLDAGVFGVNVASKKGSTAVIHAAANGHVDMLRLLMQRGADPYMCNWYGNALHCAVEANFASTVRELIIGCGMDPEDDDDSGSTYLTAALDNDAAEAFEALVDLGADVNTEATVFPLGLPGRSGDGSLPIFISACAMGCYRIVDLMIKRGWADVNMRDADGQTALHWAAQEQSLAIFERLVEAGADVDAVDHDGLSALDIKRQHSMTCHICNRMIGG